MACYQGLPTERKANTNGWVHHLLTPFEIEEILPLIEEQHGERVDKIYGRIFRKVKAGQLTQKQFRIAITFFFE